MTEQAERAALTEFPTEEARVLGHFLDAQRAAVLAIVDGLDDQGLRTPVLPSGWTPLGLIVHLGHAERHWFQQVATGSAPALPWPAEASDDEDAAFASAHPTAQVFAFYRDQCRQSNAVLASRPLSSPPAGKHNGEMEDDITDLRWIVLHMIEETARHAGHLDAARELLDGHVGLGPR
jgi:Protein of unknown function (DUF664)